MATHTIVNNQDARQSFASPARVGNAMSTTAQFDGQEWLIFWKGQEISRLKAPDGAIISIPGGGELPRVNVPPYNAVARAAWDRRFYKAKRCATLEELETRCKQEYYWDQPRACRMPAVTVYLSEQKNCAVSYRRAMEGWAGVPFLWWAGPTATPEEVGRLVDQALQPLPVNHMWG